MVSRKSLEGLVFNDITIVKYLYTNKLNKSVYLCYCSCGKFKEIVGSAVKSGNTKSCGCKQFEHSTTHGLTNHPLYQKWADMKTRCLNPNNEYYYRYGGRGIKIYKEWIDFKPFYDWAITNGWKEGLSIERRDNDLGYDPDNCEFIPIPENSRRNIVSLTRRNDGTLRKREEETV